MSFMQPEVYEGDYYAIETSDGTEIVPLDVCGKCREVSELSQYLNGRPRNLDQELELEHGWLARLSAPGCLDCIGWGAYETEQEAMDALRDMYGDEEGNL